MIPYHVAHGMNGAILVLPREGLRDAFGRAVEYDSIAYIGEQDWYLPSDEAGGWQTFDIAGANLPAALEVMRTLTPSHVTFGGARGALRGEGALQTRVGESTLIVHLAANRDSYPRIVGALADWYWSGSFHATPERDVEVGHVRAGTATAARSTGGASPEPTSMPPIGSPRRSSSERRRSSTSTAHGTTH